MISACLRLYDAVPYLTMLLFCKSSAPVSLLRREKERTEGEKQGDSERNMWTGRDTKTGSGRYSDTQSQR